MRRYQVYLPFIMAVIIMGCQMSFKKAARSANYVAAISLVQIDENFTMYLESPQGAKALCMELIREREDDIEAGRYTKEQLHRDCEDIIQRKWQEYQRGMTATALTMEVFEEAIDIWDDIDSDQKKKIIGDVMRAVKDITEFIQILGIELPGPICEYYKYLDALATNFD